MTSTMPPKGIAAAQTLLCPRSRPALFFPATDHREKIMSMSDAELIAATKKLLPNDPTGSVDIDQAIMKALGDLRNFDFYLKPYRGLSLEVVLWRASEPAHIARHVIMFCSKHVWAGIRYHRWFDRLLDVIREREAASRGVA